MQLYRWKRFFSHGNGNINSLYTLERVKNPLEEFQRQENPNNPLKNMLFFDVFNAQRAFSY